jgi:hypothetical protein
MSDVVRASSMLMCMDCESGKVQARRGGIVVRAHHDTWLMTQCARSEATGTQTCQGFGIVNTGLVGRNVTTWLHMQTMV